MTELTPLWIAGTLVDGETILDVRHPYDDHLVVRTTYATDAQVERAVTAADAVRREAAALPIHERAQALAAISRAIADRAEEITRLITAENGKPLVWARAEVSRAVSVFRMAAEATRIWSGEVMRLDTDKAAEGPLA